MTRRTQVLVVGGGVTGTGVARDLAMRGADVTLVERDRLAEGTTGRMHGLLHSGARYAVADPESARQCIRENGILRDIASHCIEETGGLFVSLEGDDSAYYERKLAACDGAGIPTREVEPETARQIEPELCRDVKRAFLVPDAAIDPFRLVAANAASAESHGATILSGTEVVDLHLESGAVAGAIVETSKGVREEIEAEHVVNAAGPWVADVVSSLDTDLDIPLTPAKGAMAVTNSRPVDTVINRCRPKREGDILVPHETTAILGTTDVELDEHEDPDDFEETESEIELLVEELSEMVPALADSRLIRTYWGVRPLYKPVSVVEGGDSGDSADASRDFAVLDHGERDGLVGLTTVLGGKLTTYRLMAEHVADEVAGRLGIDADCRTGEEPLPGSAGEVDFRTIMDRFDLKSPIAARSADRLGDRAEEVLDAAGPNPLVCECEGVTAAEARDAIDSVGPDLGAVRMRTRTTMGTCQGGFCSHRLAMQLSGDYDRETVWGELESLIAERWKGQQFVLSGDQLSQVALNRAVVHLSLNLPAGGVDTQSVEFDRFDAGPEQLPGAGRSPAPQRNRESSESRASGTRDGFDVAVIGGGLAGRMAALAAAEEGASVALLSRSESTLRSSTGVVDLLGYHPDGRGPIDDAFGAIAELPGTHPLTTVGEGGVGSALEFFDSVVGDAYMGGHTDKNALVPTQMGTPKPAARYPRSFAPGLLSRGGDVLLLGLDGFPGLDGEFAAAELSTRDLPYRVRGANVDRLGEVRVEQPRLRLASALDRNEPLPDRGGTIRDSLAAAIDAVHRGESRVGLPGVLGRTKTREIREELASAIGARVFEYPTDPPSIPGIRLADRLDRAMRSRGVRTREVVDIAEFSGSAEQIEELRLADREEVIRSDAYILATGGLIGGGIEERGGHLAEPVFDLPVAGGDVTGAEVDMDPFAPQAFAKAGVLTDGSLRPVGRFGPGQRADSSGEAGNGEFVYENLRACGSVLGGFDIAVEGSGSGVSIATGVQAGLAAAREVLE